jgi:hypothetical protein
MKTPACLGRRYPHRLLRTLLQATRPKYPLTMKFFVPMIIATATLLFGVALGAPVDVTGECSYLDDQRQGFIRVFL